jgi:hypothetical protein
MIYFSGANEFEYYKDQSRLRRRSTNSDGVRSVTSGTSTTMDFSSLQTDERIS